MGGASPTLRRDPGRWGAASPGKGSRPECRAGPTEGPPSPQGDKPRSGRRCSWKGLHPEGENGPWKKQPVLTFLVAAARGGARAAQGGAVGRGQGGAVPVLPRLRGPQRPCARRWSRAPPGQLSPERGARAGWSQGRGRGRLPGRGQKRDPRGPPGDQPSVSEWTGAGSGSLCECACTRPTPRPRARGRWAPTGLPSPKGPAGRGVRGVRGVPRQIPGCCPSLGDTRGICASPKRVFSLPESP